MQVMPGSHKLGLLSEFGHTITPEQEAIKTSRRYWDNTLILETRFEPRDGVVAIIDFMPPRGKASDVVRLVRGIEGRVKMRMELVIRFGTGSPAAIRKAGQ